MGQPCCAGESRPTRCGPQPILADRFADGRLRTTNVQNLLIVNVPRQNVDPLVRELDAVGLPGERLSLLARCCRLQWLRILQNLRSLKPRASRAGSSEELEERLPGFEQHLKLHVTGCPNGCGQHWIADLGIEGKKIKVGDRMEDAYYFCVGAQ